MKIKYFLLAGLLQGAAFNAAFAQAPVENLSGGSTEQRLSALERTISARMNAQQTIQTQLDEMQLEVNELRGAVELHTHKLEQILQRQRELYLEIDKRMEAVLAMPQSLPQEVPTEQAPVANNSLSENDAYDKAVNLILKEKRYDDAIPEFQQFLKDFPQSSYAPNAHYWLGQLLFNKRDWANAEQHFDQVVRFYPDSSKRADSMLKLGVIAQKKSNIARATQLFEQVISEYPNASEKRLAENRLRNLQQN